MRIKVDSAQLDLSVIREAIQILDKGGVIVYPTDTAYGIGCNAFNTEAVERIFTIKKRPIDQALPVIVSSFEMIDKIAHINPQSEILMKKFYPGPLVIALPKKESIPNILNKQGIAFRIPSEKISFNLVKGLNKPIISTSANKSGFPSPYSIDEVLSSIKAEEVDLLIDIGPTQKRKPSTIIDFLLEPSPQITRIGEISPEEIFLELGIEKEKWKDHMKEISH